MLRILLPGLAFLLLGAHLLFHGAGLFAFLAVIPIALLFVRSKWTRRLNVLLLALGTVEWARTAVLLVLAREAQGRPWLTAGAILGAVTLFTLLACALLIRRK